MRTKYKHIHFEKRELPPTRKTEEWICWNESKQYLGDVRWDNGWRQYCWFQEDGGIVGPTKMAASCLDDISHFIKQLMDARK